MAEKGKTKSAAAEKILVQEDNALQSSLDHVMAELDRIGLKLQLRVQAMGRTDSPDNGDQFRGLCVTSEEVENIQSPGNRTSENTKSRSESAAFTASEKAILQMEQSISARKKEALERGLVLRLDVLQRLFGLSRFDIDTLLICLLPEIDLRYQRLFAYLQDDVTKKNPAVDLILHLLCDSLEGMLKSRQNFSNESPLMAYQLIHLHDDPISRPTPLLAKFVQMDERIISYLLDSSQVDTRLTGLASLFGSEIKLKDVVLAEDIKARLLKLTQQYGPKSLLGYFNGADEARKLWIAGAIASEMGLPLLRVEISNLLTADIPAASLIPIIFREGCLQNAVLYFSNFEILLNEDKDTRHLYKTMLAELKNYPFWTILSGEKDWLPKGISGDKPYFNVEVSAASYSERTQTWNLYKEDDVALASDVNLADLAGKFRFTSGQISDAVAMARNLARWRDPDKVIITSEDLYAACRKQSRETLNALARKIQPKYHWKDIILPADQMSQLREIANYVAHYHTVYSEWGFGRKIATGKGLNVLFAGVSGTGKTMAAEVIAHELGIDLYKIDLSGIVSKYIGETEKNLDQIFRDGETSNAILFFDEADALFGKRSEVRDSHDRYANIEVAYLLQKMDDYSGIVILATNLRKNMDEAFARRMHYTLEFPVPEETDRLRIWENIFPSEAPVSGSLDLKFMAKQFKITGGNIKNIALNAAFLATQNGGVIKTEHLIQATRREYQKIGKLCTEGEFAQYFELVKS